MHFVLTDSHLRQLLEKVVLDVVQHFLLESLLLVQLLFEDVHLLMQALEVLKDLILLD